MNASLHNSLSIESYKRNGEDLQNIASFLQSLEFFTPLSVADLYNIAKFATKSTFEANTLLYRKGDSNGPWYLILSGSVLINKILYNQFKPFGYEVSSCRPYDCFVIEKTEVMVIDCTINWNRFDPLYSSHNNYHNHFAVPLVYSDLDEQSLDRLSINSIPSHSNENASSIVETSSLYSIAGSSGGIPDFSGLQESAVDSDIEYDNYGFSDVFYESIKKNLDERTDADITCIYSALLNFQIFRDMPQPMAMQLSSVMTYAQIDDSGVVLLSDGENLDSWTVILAGELKWINGSSMDILKPGNCFGIEPTEEIQLHKGILETLSEECRCGVVSQEEYIRIIKETEEKTNSIIEKGQIVMVTQSRNINGRGQSDILLRATPDRLFLELLKDPPSDLTYIEDYLLTYRTFYPKPILLAQKLNAFFEESREKVIFILFDWIRMHLIDFEQYQDMSQFLDDFESKLKFMEMSNHLRRLHELLDSKSQPRVINFSRATHDNPLGFSLVRSSPKAILICDVIQGSKAQNAGIKIGDEILEVNGQLFKNLSLEKSLEILNSSTHLMITVKSNLIGYNDTVHAKKKSQKKQKNNSQDVKDNRLSKNKMDFLPVIKNKLKAHDDGLLVTGPNYNKIKNTLMKIMLPKQMANGEGQKNAVLDDNSVSTLVRNRLSLSNPNLNTITKLSAIQTLYEDLDVIKIYRADQTFRFIKIDKELTAGQAVMLAVIEFNLNTANRLASEEYSLYEVSLQPKNDNCVMQRRLKDTTNNLASRASLYSRYYLKENGSSDPLFPEDAITDLKSEVQFDLLTLDEMEVAYQLTCRSLDLFSKVKPSEYVVELFKLGEEGGGYQNLNNFTQVSNTEMFWIVSCICMESNLNQRIKILKKFIQIAKCCIDCQNFNSAFAIISGLGHQAVIRLKHTWDKLPNKYSKLFENLQSLMDPTRNMLKYRTRISKLRPPIIPFFPLTKKDLTFIHLGNESVVGGLINFEKLRMVAKEIRSQYSMVLGQDNFIQNSDVENETLNRLKYRLRYQVMLTSSSSWSMKQIYDASLMTKKVSTYLDGRKIIYNEDQLQEMSNCCEGQSLKRSDNNSGSSVNILKSFPSSSKIVESPDNACKLANLSEKARPNKKPISSKISSHSFLSQSNAINIPKSQTRSFNSNQSQPSSINSQKSKSKDNISTKSASPHLNPHSIRLSRESSSLSSSCSRPILQQSQSLRESTQNLAQKNLSLKPLSELSVDSNHHHVKSNSEDLNNRRVYCDKASDCSAPVIDGPISLPPLNKTITSVYIPPHSKNKNKDQHRNSDNQISSV